MGARPGVGAAHFEIGLEPHFGKNRGEMIGPVRHGGAFARQLRQASLQQVAKACAGDVVIDVAALDEIHRHVERIVDIALEAISLLEDEGQHAGAIRVGVAPDE